MELTERHLAPIFENITVLLQPLPGMLEQFEPWADAQTDRLRRAAQFGVASLAFEAEQMRDELALLTPPAEFDRMLTERSERVRLCQRQWLTGLIDFVDDLIGDPVPALLAA
ncbi:MAG: hypothetical protein U0228_04585 [Myxococcaceae bacterium]